MARKTGSHAQTTAPLVRQAAMRLIARHGYAAVSMRQIAAEIDMRAGALYLYTPDREAFYLKLGWKQITSERYHGHDVTIMEADLETWMPDTDIIT